MALVNPSFEVAESNLAAAAVPAAISPAIPISRSDLDATWARIRKSITAIRKAGPNAIAADSEATLSALAEVARQVQLLNDHTAGLLDLDDVKNDPEKAQAVKAGLGWFQGAAEKTVAVLDGIVPPAVGAAKGTAAFVEGDDAVEDDDALAEISFDPSTAAAPSSNLQLGDIAGKFKDIGTKLGNAVKNVGKAITGAVAKPEVKKAADGVANVAETVASVSDVVGQVLGTIALIPGAQGVAGAAAVVGVVKQIAQAVEGVAKTVSTASGDAAAKVSASPAVAAAPATTPSVVAAATVTEAPAAVVVTEDQEELAAVATEEVATIAATTVPVATSTKTHGRGRGRRTRRGRARATTTLVA
ncbi:hypothetical protein HDU96_004437 [Phlyctochytrium bullatum]|nr:hypothetical protein HDU96_004437 [Phlyctochytrium bullatum]